MKLAKSSIHAGFRAFLPEKARQCSIYVNFTYEASITIP